MRKILLLVFALILLAVPVFAAPVYTDIVSFDDSAAGNTLTFSYQSVGFNAHIIDVCNNDSADVFYFVVHGATPSADPHTDHISIMVRPGRCYRWQSAAPTPSMTGICDAGKTCSNTDIVAME